MAQQHLLAMEHELHFREKMAALLGDHSNTAMVENFQQLILQELSSMTELEKIERGIEKLEHGRMEGLDQLHRIVRKLKEKVTGVTTGTSVPCQRNTKQGYEDGSDGIYKDYLVPTLPPLQQQSCMIR